MKKIIEETDACILYYVKYKFKEPASQSFNDDIKETIKVEEYRVKTKFTKKKKLFCFKTLHEAINKIQELNIEFKFKNNDTKAI